jgi:hypothetical protein
MSYIGSTPTTQSFIAGTDYFNGTGSATAFTLSRSVVSVNDIQATVNNVVQVPNDAYTVNGTTITFTSAPSAGTNNIYVRYLSTTTQSITPSQNTVSYSTLNSDNQSKLGISFKNRIINGAMVIDQRNNGAVLSTSSNGAFNLDRWYNQNNSGSNIYNIQQNAGSVTPPVGFGNYLGLTSTSAYTVGSSSVIGVGTRIEGYNIADLNWGTANAKTITLSFWVYSSITGTFGGSILNGPASYSYPFTYTISSANTWTYITITVAGPTSSTWSSGNSTTNGSALQLVFSVGTGSTFTTTANAWVSGQYYSATGATSGVINTNGATFYLTGVQLEVGTQATTFDYRSITTETSLCQRYYTRYTPNSSSGAGNFMSGTVTNPNEVRVLTSLPTLMRTDPTFSYANLRAFDGAIASVINGINAQGSSPTNGGVYLATVGSVLTIGRGAIVIENGSSNVWIAFSAEL